MQRREFHLSAAALVGGSLLPGCGGGGGGGGAALALPGATGQVPPELSSLPPTGDVGTVETPSSAPESEPPRQAVVRSAVPMGTNLSGMEWARPGLRYGLSSAPNLHFTVPRPQEVAELAASGFSKNRLPVQWELLQPMLHDSRANAAARGAIGEPGAFHAAYESYITSVLDAHAAAGIQCIVDLHNYCRYQDFRFQPDGSVLGLTPAPDASLRPYTTDNSQVQVRIFSLASGATLTPANFGDFWARAARKWKSHPGFGGYGLMNEPHDMPVRGGVNGVYDAPPYSGLEDLTIWPTFAQAAIDAIRAIDPANPIYVSGNAWDSAMFLAGSNPGFPLRGANLIYEVHLYLDAASNGNAFDYDIEVAKNFSAGGSGPIGPLTGRARLKMAVDWAWANGVRLALTEVGMPVDDPRWQRMFVEVANYAVQAGCEIYSWMGGNHWAVRSHAINHVPGWHQNRTQPPLVAGPMLAASGIFGAVLFDDGPSYGVAGLPLTITVFARGALAAPLTLTVSSSQGGVLGTSRIVLPAGPNPQVSFTYIPAGNRISTLSYAGAAQVPPPRRIFSLTNPAAYAATSVADAAFAILAKYGACKWEMADGHTDFLRGRRAEAGETVRAISDSGYGSSPANAMEMLNWTHVESSPAGTGLLPKLRVVDGKRATDHSAPGTRGFWCKKAAPQLGIRPRPETRVPYDVQDPHFVLAAVSVPGASNTGVVFQASKSEDNHASELCLRNGQPQARWVDAAGRQVELVAPTRLVAGRAALITTTSEPGRQSLRVDGREVASASAAFAASPCSQMLIGWGFLSYYPRDGFGGTVYGVITGKGRPSPTELAVLEHYLASTSGQRLG
ncbi:MAG: twin-arginine translocation pathway signal protein [Comamonadaceae bacterium]|nr:MAG: twin-arginine translocation pathway signal protein [Comamonadaceae bacterium]